MEEEDMRGIRWRTLVIGALVVTVASAVAVPKAYAKGPTGASGSAEPVLVWSGYAEQAVVAGRPPASSAVLLGIVHIGMYDTAAALGLHAQAYLARERTPRDTSAAAAIATVAHRILVARIPAQQASLDAQYDQYLAGVPDGRAKSAGVALGKRVAARVLRWRDDDGLDATVPYVQRPPGPGVWQPTAPTPPVDLILTQVRPLAMRSVDQFRPAGPYALSDPRYLRDLDEVRRLGRADSAERTVEQTALARFWADQTAAQWSRAVRRIAAERGLNLGQAARLLAMVWVSTGDAGIACFDAKYHYRFWRPVHAIQANEPTWQPLLNINHPEYPSGHACLTGAVTTALTAYFGSDRFTYTVDSTTTGLTRTYQTFSASLADVTEARIWSGLHFRHSMQDGAAVGRRAAGWALSHHFRC
jgi:PAP2 superfamily